MANASEITELSLFKAKPIPVVFRFPSRSLTKILDILERMKAQQSQEKENTLRHKHLYGPIKRYFR